MGSWVSIVGKGLGWYRVVVYFEGGGIVLERY